MKVAWWLHRTLFIGLSGFGLLFGAYVGLHLVSYVNHLRGIKIPYVLQYALLPVSAIIGASIPQLLFRKLIHAACPEDGEAMIHERIRVYTEYHKNVGNLVSRYRCRKCGLTK